MRVCGGVLLAASLAACSSDPIDDRGLSMARVQWSRQQLTAYRFTWQRACVCAPEQTRPMRATVVNDQITSAVYADDGTEVADSDRRTVNTVDAVFDRLEMIAAERPAKLEVIYDPVLSYPTSALVDENSQIADDEFLLQISDLVALVAASR